MNQGIYPFSGPSEANRWADVGGLLRPNLKIDTTSNSTATVSADALMLRDEDNQWCVITSLNDTVDVSKKGLGGLDTGVEAGSTWYYIWAISDGRQARCILSTSNTAPVMPPGFSFRAFLGALRNGPVGGVATDLVHPHMQRGTRCSFVYQNVFATKSVAVANAYELLSGGALTNFRACVPPTATWMSCIFGMDSANAASLALSGCAADGTLDANRVGESIHVGGTDAGFTFFVYKQCVPMVAPVRGGAAYNIQWASATTLRTQRMDITGYGFD